MCVQRVWRESPGTLSLETFRELIAHLRTWPAMPTIHLGGYGEPMIHPDFAEIVRAAKEAGARVEVTTNGCLLTPDLIEMLLDLDLDRLVVSIDGASPASYEDIRVRASFQQVIDNLRALYRRKLQRADRHANPQVGIAFVAMKSNIADLPKLPTLATQIGAWDIQVSNVVPHTSAMEREILYDRALTACAYRASPWVADVSLPKLDLDADTAAPLQALYHSRASVTLLDRSLSARNDYCKFAQEGYAAIRWDGMVGPCLSLLHDHPEYIRGRRKNVQHYDLGNIHAQPLGDIWASDEFANFRAKLREFPYSPCTTCGGCERFPRNLEDCSENYFPACGGCLWAQGLIQCP
jgi:MoaA/NifB/PqqE/SkfB family radical SAM enzyme